jgi:hypothetical protein
MQRNLTACKTLYPFLSFYGSKWRSAARYPAPEYKTIFEPFAGSAGYSLRYPDRRVVLIEKDPRLAGIWRFLIRARPSDVLALPLMDLDASISDLPECDPDGRELIRAWLQGGSRNGKNSFSSMAKSCLKKNSLTPAFWGRACRSRIAAQVDAIKHWTIIEGDYSSAPDEVATWFVDPPYNNAAGRVYRFHKLDYSKLGSWCCDRRGQVLVCENVGASWLPFKPLYETSNNWNTGAVKKSGEVLWNSGDLGMPR